MQGPTLSNTKPKYRLLVYQSQSPFLIPATWLLSDLYPTSLYYCDLMIYPPKNRMDGCMMVHDLEILKKGSTESRKLCRRWGHNAIVS